MHRRAFLSVTTAAALTAGCLSGGSSGPGIEVHAEGTDPPSATTSFEASWNARLQGSLGPTDNEPRLSARDGRAFFTVRMEVENDGESRFETSVGHFLVRTEAGEHLPLDSNREGYYGGVELAPGEIQNAFWVASIPDDVPEATITVAETYRDSVEATFLHSPDLAIDVPE